VAKTIETSSEGLRIFDCDKAGRVEVGRIAPSDYDEVFIIVLLDSWAGMFASAPSLWINVDPKVGTPWVVDVDSCESILEAIGSADVLAKFLRWRRSVDGIAINDDEAIFAGFYLHHGPYQLPGHADVVYLDASYGDILESRHFRKLGYDEDEVFPVETPSFTTPRPDGDRFVDCVKTAKTFPYLRASPYPPPPEPVPEASVGRNSRCPCGSGLKYKKCCIDRLR
jgi:hypothetical protein